MVWIFPILLFDIFKFLISNFLAANLRCSANWPNNADLSASSFSNFGNNGVIARQRDNAVPFFFFFVEPTFERLRQLVSGK